jgi:glycosyltransferase involved in cell wall biosynthesis
MMPLLSIAMPSLNQREFIESAIRSALDQPVNGVELTISDGGSTDGTVELLRMLSAEYGERLRWISKPDEGPAQAINRAVRMARAPLIGWLNSDDLYMPGALQRALEHFASHQDHVMAYGNAEHVDVNGVHIEPYPSLPPTVPIERFRDGCFICQPSVFFRRDAFEALGGLDESIRASFDFELWLRFFKRYPGRIGFIEALQARSRLHAGGITLRFRERVAREGIEVLSRHLGSAPAHWLLTHFEELFAAHPFHPEAIDLRSRFAELLTAVQDKLDPGGVEQVQEFIARDCRLRVNDRDVGVGISADGWATQRLEVRVRQPDPAIGRVWLDCVYRSPSRDGLRMTILGSDGTRRQLELLGDGPFVVPLELSDRTPGAELRFLIESEGGFVPAEWEPGSADRRRLAFRVEGFRCGIELPG